MIDIVERLKNPVAEALVKHLVDRFLGWKLPTNFSPDAGISFKADFNEHTAYPMKHEPVGTNLFDADQATAMVRYMLEGFDFDAAAAPDVTGMREVLRFGLMWARIPAGSLADSVRHKFMDIAKAALRDAGKLR